MINQDYLNSRDNGIISAVIIVFILNLNHHAYSAQAMGVLVLSFLSLVAGVFLSSTYNGKFRIFYLISGIINVLMGIYTMVFCSVHHSFYILRIPAIYIFGVLLIVLGGVLLYFALMKPDRNDLNLRRYELTIPLASAVLCILQLVITIVFPILQYVFSILIAGASVYGIYDCIRAVKNENIKNSSIICSMILNAIFLIVGIYFFLNMIIL